MRESPDLPPPDPGDVQAFMGMVIERVAECIDDLASQIVDDIRAQVPSYAEMGPDAIAVVRDGVHRAMRAYIRVMSEGRGPTPTELGLIETISARPAALGISHAEMMASFWVGMRRSWRFITEQAATLPPSPAALSGLGELLLASGEYVQEVAAAVSRGFLARESEEVTKTIRAQREVVDDLLSGAFDSDAELLQRGRGVGIDLECPYGLLVLVVANDPTPPARTLRQAKLDVLSRIEGALDGSLHTTPFPHAVVVTPAKDAATWARALTAVDGIVRDGGVVALAIPPVDNPSAIHAEYQRSLPLVPLAAQACTPGAASRQDLAVHRILATAHAEAAELVADTLGPLFSLPDSRWRPLVEVLDGLWECDGRLGETAQYLHLSEKAVAYRLRRIRALTGLDARVPADRLRLDLARQALRLLPQNPG